MTHLTHLRGDGTAFMVDVTEKSPTRREATAVGSVLCSRDTTLRLSQGMLPKGDALAVARIAGIAGAKKTADLLPLAHIIGVHSAEVDISIGEGNIDVSATVRAFERTGVEMEALTAVTLACLALVDMLKGIDRTVVISDCKIVHKSGGRSGEWHREEPQTGE